MVLVIDEAQSMTDRSGSGGPVALQPPGAEHVRLCVFSVASVQFFDEPIGLALSGGAHVAARFMLATERFRGCAGSTSWAFVMSGYDHATEWPQVRGSPSRRGSPRMPGPRVSGWSRMHRPSCRPCSTSSRPVTRVRTSFPCRPSP